MGQGSDTVVDERLRGLGGLHVVDASTRPTEVSGDTRAAVLTTAEKGADPTPEDGGA